MEDRFLSLLGTFGLSERERKIYYFLLTSGKRTANECAKFLGISRMETYRIIKDMERKRLVLSVPGRPVKYQAESIEFVTYSIMDEFTKRIKSMELAREEILSLFERLPKYEQKSESRFRFVQGREQIYSYVDRLIESTSRTLDLILTSNDLVCLNILGSLEKIVSRKDKVKFRILTYVEEPVLEHVSSILNSVEVRHSKTSEKGRLVLSDGSVVLTSLLLDSSPGLRNDKDVAIVVEGKDYSQMMSDLFNFVFSSSESATKRLEEIKRSKQRNAKIESIIEVAKAISKERGWNFYSPAYLEASDGKKYSFTFMISSSKGDIYVDAIVSESVQEAIREAFSTVAKKIEFGMKKVVLVVEPYSDEVERVASSFGITTVSGIDPINTVSTIKTMIE